MAMIVKHQGRPAERQLLEYAAFLERMAYVTPNTRDHLATELAHLDSMPTYASGADRDKITGTLSELTAVEAAASVTLEIRSRLADLDDMIHDLGERLRVLNHVNGRAAGYRAPRDTKPAVMLCRDGGFGKDLSPELAADIATCMRTQDRKQLCEKHYRAWYRERVARGEDTSRMFEPSG